MVERRVTPEFREPLAPSDAARIAGSLEIAGSVGFHLSGGRVASPFCQMTEKDPDVAVRFMEKYGGNRKSRGLSTQWIVGGADAARIGESCIAFAPSRWEMLELFSAWNSSSSHIDRFLFGSSLPTSHRSPVRQEEYERLLQNPYFFAGIFDARRSDCVSRKVRRNGLRVEERSVTVASTNIQLLSALQEILAGTMQIRGGDKSYGKSMNLVIAAGPSLQKIDDIQREYGIAAAVPQISPSLKR